MPKSNSELDEIKQRWLKCWPEALSIWGRFTRLSEPVWCSTEGEERREGLSDSFAMIRFPDHSIVISLPQVQRHGLENFGLEVLAHEIGHHILCPSDLADQGRMLTRMRRSLPTQEGSAPFVANLYADLLINDRLQRHGSLRMAQIYQCLKQPGATRLWLFYMRIYELLWKLPARSLTHVSVTGVMEADAHLGARLIRSYARNWLDGSGRFAALCLPYLLDKRNAGATEEFAPLLDGLSPGAGSQDSANGLTEIESNEQDGSLHPSQDPRLSGEEERDVLAEEPSSPESAEGSTKDGDSTNKNVPRSEPGTSSGGTGSTGQFREPFEYGEILKALGLELTSEQAAIRYYRERAMPHLIPYPTIIMPESSDPQPEGLEPWDIGSPLEEVDWLQSVLLSPHIIPGLTTVTRTWGTCEGHDPGRRPVDLDLYVDCSGSMPDPRHNVSYLALAGAIIALSALRTGACVQATLWSGPQQFQKTNGFVSDENEILGVVAGYIGGSTAFPLHILRETHFFRKPTDRAVHILVISDSGCDTMFMDDETGLHGADICREALEKARGGGTLVLNLYEEWETFPFCKDAHAMGFDVHRVQDWNQLEQFARKFSAKKYGQSQSDLARGRKKVP